MNASSAYAAPCGPCLTSEACDALEFARAAVGWGRLRVEAEVERELQALDFLRERARLECAPLPKGLYGYVNFLRRLGDWLRTGHAPRHARRDTREPMRAIAEALARRGQLDAPALAALDGQPRYRRRRARALPG